MTLFENIASGRSLLNHLASEQLSITKWFDASPAQNGTESAGDDLKRYFHGNSVYLDGLEFRTCRS